MDRDSALSQICRLLHDMRAADPPLRNKLTDAGIERYVAFCQGDAARLACPVCFLTKGRISYLLYPTPPRIFPNAQHLICEFCTTGIPISTVSERVA